ncbi:MAG: Holliday junction branch migration protein RuvA [Bacillota bacterium]
MIAMLKGTVDHLGPDYLVLFVSGVGYRVFITTALRSRLKAGTEVTLHTHLHVKEDSLTLYGFEDQAELQLFSLLISVSGVGPRLALNVLSCLTPDEFRKALVFEESRVLQRVPGIGKKGAERILLELKDRVTGSAREAVRGAQGAPAPPGPSGEAMMALLALGYSRAEAAAALERALPEAGAEKTDELVKLCLKILAR